MSRTILITGGSGKFGASLIGHFLSLGDKVITNSRHNNTVSELTKRYRDYGDKFAAIKCDFTTENAIPDFIQLLYKDNIQPDCLVNNARSINFLKIEANGSISRENFSGEFLLDVIVPYELTIALAMQKNSRLSRVINIGSQYGSVAANPNLYDDPVAQSPLHYSVCKAALAHLTKELAVRLASKNIQVNCIAFGGVEGRVDEQFKARYAKLCPMGRMLQDKEVCGPVDMLLSEHFSGMTGHVLNVDGGWGIW